VLSKIQIKKFNEFAQSDKLNDLLQIANKDSLVDYMWGRELIDLFLEFPQTGMSAQDFVGLLRPMPPRLYSIASSLSAHSKRCTLRLRWFAMKAMGEKEKVFARPIWQKGWGRPYLAICIRIKILNYQRLIHSNHYGWTRYGYRPRFVRLLRSVSQAVQLEKTGCSSAIVVKKPDYLYGDEWESYQKDGILNELDLAWSRDQAEKVYVQHKMLEKKALNYGAG
jgi:sulfite reductase (NADPH) flavoprotein alpha-component